MSRRDFNRLATTVILGAVLAACTPEGQAQEIKPAITQTIDGLDVPGEGEEAIIETITATSTPEHTATPENTATPEKTEAENMHEYCIQRAKEVGIDLENLADSNNLWLTEIQGLENLQEAFETSFSDDRVFKTMLVVGIDSLNSQARYDQAPTTAANKKIMGWLEAVYQTASGQYQMVLLPVEIWDIEKELMWDKSPIISPPRYATDINSGHAFTDLISNYSAPYLNPSFKYAELFTISYAQQDYWMGPGAFINFDSEYPGNEEFTGGAGMIEDPSYSEEQMLDFRSTGNTDFFPYFMIDNKTGIEIPFIYPFINYATLSETDNYQNQAFIEEVLTWWFDEQWLNPDGPPPPQHWQTLP